MKLVSATPIERSIGGPRFELAIDPGSGIAVQKVEATQMYTFENGWTLFLIENLAAESGRHMILANPLGELSRSDGKKPFALTPDLDAPCPKFPKMRYRDCYYCWHQIEHPEMEPPRV